MVVRAIAKPFSPDSKKVETFSAISNISEPTPEQLDLHKAQMDAIMAERSQVYSKHSGPEREKGLDVPDLHHCSWTRYRQFISDSYYAPRHEIEMNVDSAFSSIQKPDSTYPGHPVVDFDRGEQVGYWAPDLPSSQETLEVTCLAISSNRQFVFCIAMEPVNEYENRFRRIGLVFWGKSAWERMVLETGQSLVDLE
jgi:hypothetical protein